MFFVLKTVQAGTSSGLTATIGGTQEVKLSVPSIVLELGQFDKAGKKEVTIANKLNRDIEISDWRVPCPCLEVDNMPDRIEAGKSAVISITVLPDGYSGRIVKHMPITIQDRGASKVLFLPVALVAGKAVPTAMDSIKSFSMLEYQEYDGGKLDDKRYSSTVAWLFGAKNCPQCNYLKHFVFPVMFKSTDKMVVVNLDNKEGFMVLVELEQRLKITKPGQPPVLFFEGKLYYGSAEIKKLLPAGKSPLDIVQNEGLK